MAAQTLVDLSDILHVQVECGNEECNGAILLSLVAQVPTRASCPQCREELWTVEHPECLLVSALAWVGHSTPSGTINFEDRPNDRLSRIRLVIPGRT